MIVTNAMLTQQAEAGFILSGKIYRDGDGIEFEVPSAGKAVLASHSLQSTYLNAEGQEPVFYFSRDEIQGDVPLSGIENALPPEYRILRIMPSLTLHDDGKALLPLTLRGKGASDVGKWGCASALVSSAIDTETIFATLNRETGLLVDGQIALIQPSRQDVADGKVIDKVYDNAISLKKILSDRVPQLRSAFNKNGAGTMAITAHLQLPEQHDTVTFHGALNGSVKCVAYDNPTQRTLTLIFPYAANVPTGSTLTPFDGQGYEGPSTLVTPEYLRKNPTGIQLIPGLHQLVHGK